MVSYITAPTNSFHFRFIFLLPDITATVALRLFARLKRGAIASFTIDNRAFHHKTITNGLEIEKGIPIQRPRNSGIYNWPAPYEWSSFCERARPVSG